MTDRNLRHNDLASPPPETLPMKFETAIGGRMLSALLGRWPIKEDKKMDINEIDEVAKKLAEHYGEQRQRECGCIGLSCHDLGCSLWWRLFIIQNTAEDIYKMVNNYRKE